MPFCDEVKYITLDRLNQPTDFDYQRYDSEKCSSSHDVNFKMQHACFLNEPHEFITEQYGKKPQGITKKVRERKWIKIRTRGDRFFVNSIFFLIDGG